VPRTRSPTSEFKRVMVPVIGEKMVVFASCSPALSTDALAISTWLVALSSWARATSRDALNAMKSESESSLRLNNSRLRW
jgi:hypothetical protein